MSKRERPKPARRARIAPETHGRTLRQADERAERLTTLSRLTRLITSATDSAAACHGIAEAALCLEDVYVVFPEDLPDGEDTTRALIDGFGAEAPGGASDDDLHERASASWASGTHQPCTWGRIRSGIRIFATAPAAIFPASTN